MADAWALAHGQAGRAATSMAAASFELEARRNVQARMLQERGAGLKQPKRRARRQGGPASQGSRAEVELLETQIRARAEELAPKLNPVSLTRRRGTATSHCILEAGTARLPAARRTAADWGMGGEGVLAVTGAAAPVVSRTLQRGQLPPACPARCNLLCDCRCVRRLHRSSCSGCP